MRSADFLNTEPFPKISFFSKAIKQDNGHFKAIGNLQIAAYQKEVTIPFTFHKGELKGSFSINRLEFEVGSKFPAFFIGRIVLVDFYCKTAD